MLANQVKVFAAAGAKVFAGVITGTPFMIAADMLPHDYAIIAIGVGFLTWCGSLAIAVVGVLSWLKGQIKEQVDADHKDQEKDFNAEIRMLKMELANLREVIVKLHS